MKGLALALIVIAALSSAASWMIGYHQGQRTGAFHLLREMDANYVRDSKADIDEGRDKGRDQVCDDIRRYKFSIAKDLDENTQICGWPDMDGPKKQTEALPPLTNHQ